MKKYQYILVVFGVLGLFAVAPLSRAEEEKVEGEKRPFFNGEMQDKRKEFWGDMQDKRGEHREEMTAERRAFMEKMKTDREKFLSELKAKKEEFKSANKERKAEWRGHAKEMIGQRFEMAVRNLERIQGRVSEIIEKLNEDGKDTADAENYLDDSKENLAEAKAKIAEIKALIPDTDEKVTPEVFEKIKVLAREAKDLLKESHQDLVQAIKEIKELRKEAKEKEDEEDESDQD